MRLKRIGIAFRFPHDQYATKPATTDSVDFVFIHALSALFIIIKRIDRPSSHATKGGLM